MNWEIYQIIAGIIFGLGLGGYRLYIFFNRLKGNKEIRDILIKILQDSGARRIMIVDVNGERSLKVKYNQRINGPADIKTQETFVIRDFKNRIKYELKIQWTELELLEDMNVENLRRDINRIEELI